MRAPSVISILACIVVAECLSLFGGHHKDDSSNSFHGRRLYGRQSSNSTYRENLNKIGTGDRFDKGNLFPLGIGTLVPGTTEEDSWDSTLNPQEVESALLGLQKEYGIKVFHPPWLTQEGRQTTAALVSCSDLVDLLGECDSVSSYNVLFTAGINARERATTDILIYFISDLLYAAKKGVGLKYSRAAFTNQEVRRVLTLGIAFYPMVNVDGVAWDQQESNCDGRNRNTASATDKGGDTIGVNINRNFDHAFDFRRLVNITMTEENSDSPTSELFQGKFPLSESETKNVAWLFDAFPRIGWYMNVQTFGRSILHPWGLDFTDYTRPHMTWRNESYDGQRGGMLSELTPDGTSIALYREYMDEHDFFTYLNVSGVISLSMRNSTGYTHSDGSLARRHSAVTGTAVDWAYARHIVDRRKTKVYSFAVNVGMPFETFIYPKEEWPSLCLYYPVDREVGPLMDDASAGFMGFLLEIADRLM